MFNTNRADATQSCTNVAPRVPDAASILIVLESDSKSEQLKTAFQKAGLTSERVNDFPSGCKGLESDRFQVVFASPHLRDGSWKCLIDVANQHDLGIEVVLVARTFDLQQWAEALRAGAFDVLDALCDLPNAAVAAKRALGAADLKRFRTLPEEV